MKYQVEGKRGGGLGLALTLAALCAAGAYADQLPLEAVKTQADPFAQLAGAQGLKFRSVPISDDKEFGIKGDDLNRSFENPGKKVFGLEDIAGTWKQVLSGTVYQPKGFPDSEHPNKLLFEVVREAKSTFNPQADGKGRFLKSCTVWECDPYLPEEVETEPGYSRYTGRMGLYFRTSASKYALVSSGDKPMAMELTWDNNGGPGAGDADLDLDTSVHCVCRLLDTSHLLCRDRDGGYRGYELEDRSLPK